MRRLIFVAMVLVSMRVAHAQDDPNNPTAPTGSSQRATSLEPKPVEPPPPGRTTFDADPVRDGAVIAISIGFAGLLDMVIGTGEVRPQQISADFDTEDLLPLDRYAVQQDFSSNASMYSNLGLFAAVGFAVVDPIATGFREHHRQSAIVDAIIYAQSLSVTWAITNLSKIAVRRPRPRAYQEFEASGDPNFENPETDVSLSFFSGHASICATVTATATYLAFARSDGPRPWITLAAGTAITAFVSVNRVLSGAHFPTDVIAGALAGAGIGILVPHFHRSETAKQRPMWIGFAPETGGGRGGMLTFSGDL
jgi:membrane-associated phospholipid phosphatase